ncbi:MAG TPA: NAD(P)/FAD-dependent oxidoreductase [Candidatus Polarisedimenticolia bacterium]|jgi:NADPH-dependent 2,4-dienoyl-CoA reductase/sulfur reductase-like enzyme|nr:NAD(P)/FAD-dependent oxidoreductase [Dongiaceae bacterium]HYV88321.1 NAD(P)/FAD-dependent oxidoreductase [Candidatus Polarisedimenticolia bacterium]
MSIAPARIAVVGAGPAGIRAVETLLAHGVRPVWIDEAPRTGGQIYRRPPENFRRDAHALYGFESGKAQRLHRSADAAASRADYHPSTLVWDIAEGALHTVGPAGSRAIPFEAAILATGATDRIIPLPGWTLPGVYTLGGAQTALKAQGVAIGRRCLFFGTGPLLYLTAYQYAKAGAGVAAVLDTGPASAKRRALPELLTNGSMFAKGLYYLAWLRSRGIRIESGIDPLAIRGGAQVAGFSFRDSRGRGAEIDADAIAFGYHLRSETQLADLAGCRFAFEAVERQWLPERDEAGRAIGTPGIYLAGDGAGITGADAAEATGERAALALLADRGMSVSATRCADLERKLAQARRFRNGLATAFPFPAYLARKMNDETILCRCEAVTAGTLRASIGGIAASELNRAKAFARVGMGRCQGRVCGNAAAEVLASALNCDIGSVGRLRSQPPVKPLPVGLL